ncbi:MULTISPECIES: redoxin domain-containing protein [unclassified Brevundimonas]|uniref:redoxin domain-containing protein n=1 Tax=unclassified Brevundimonas TaxID=2622653 RepID=UPI0025C4E533|nr:MULTISPECIES: redoxin domain-containing protein [unclassified Brevundimonas]
MFRILTVASASLLLLAACQQQPAAAPDTAAVAEAAAAAVAGPGDAAPAFTLVDAQGAQRSLADFKGKTVVLEWTNEGCPYVKKHYTGAMQACSAKRPATAWCG